MSLTIDAALDRLSRYSLQLGQVEVLGTPFSSADYAPLEEALAALRDDPTFPLAQYDIYRNVFSGDVGLNAYLTTRGFSTDFNGYWGVRPEHYPCLRILRLARDLPLADDFEVDAIVSKLEADGLLSGGDVTSIAQGLTEAGVYVAPFDGGLLRLFLKKSENPVDGVRRHLKAILRYRQAVHLVDDRANSLRLKVLASFGSDEPVGTVIFFRDLDPETIDLYTRNIHTRELTQENGSGFIDFMVRQPHVLFVDLSSQEGIKLLDVLLYEAIDEPAIPGAAAIRAIMDRITYNRLTTGGGGTSGGNPRIHQGLEHSFRHGHHHHGSHFDRRFGSDLAAQGAMTFAGADVFAASEAMMMLGE